MARSTVHYADNKTNNALKKLHNKLRPAGTPVQRVEYIIELLLLRIFETKIKQDEEFKPLRKLFTSDYRWKNPKTGQEESNENRLFSYLPTVTNEQISAELNDNFFPFYSTILQSARQVFKGNLPQKVQDQLVLIEEVFSNSNFTNNVNSGNLGEVIGIVANDIEESRLLKTDLLGDAIESALSETGGTKDIGLFRTPDHVRQFMTALVEPTFDDLVFDPACGTGGFLFDAFEFVMRRVDPSRDWPGEKAHSELRSWFNIYFKNHPINFPSIEQTTQFYRSGVAGIEYLGMIRKMAAINFYIRGLNPANIQQGDSLAKYNAVVDGGSKTVVVANPPFGAERDQEAYPDVWGEYPKESETTILFVKLMFELLKETGRCAVIVSEGFHTWDQNSAKALRKMLLDEAQLKAIISLPQGLFVSKGGQGPKTSILLYEKGGKTDWIWFYKVTNDGYTMGTNRREQKGNQLVECLNLFHKYVKQGKQPPESKHQFCIPADWIKTLDPRIKEKIRTDTRADMEAKAKLDRIKKTEDLDKKIASKKLTKAGKQMELKIFDQMLENRIQNEIAKRIDKAHNYSFNLSNYKSTLSVSQISEWKEAIKRIKQNGPTTLDEVYKKLSQINPEASLPYLAKLNPVNSLEANIGREYVSNLDENVLSNHKEFSSIKDILRSKVKYPIEKLEGKIEPRYVKIKKDDYDGVIDIIEKISFADGKIHLRDENETGMDLYKVEKGDLITSKINIHQGAVAIAERKLVCSTHYQVYEIDRTQILPEYLVIALRSKQFQDRIKEVKNNGIKNEQGADFLKSQEIPFPSPDEQAAIVKHIEKQKAIIEGAQRILDNFQIHIPESSDKRPLREFINDSLYGISTKLQDKGRFPVLRMNNLDIRGNWHLTDLKYIDNEISKERKLIHGDFIFNRTNSIDLIGKSSVIDFEFNGTWAGYLIRLRLNELLNPFYLKYLFTTERYRNIIKSIAKPAGGQANINTEELASINIDYCPLEIQQQIVAEINSQMKNLEALRDMKNKAEQIIEKILSDVWGTKITEL
jgi:type I restriction-modification system DNA methylase subunit/restriction endonuclease S subunit